MIDRIWSRLWDLWIDFVSCLRSTRKDEERGWHGQSL
jgi:hypothetical protein